MKTIRSGLLAMAVAGAVGLGAVALADGSKPDADELIAIATALQKLGYTSWDDIEFDEGKGGWEVDDAVGPDGKEVDLILDPDTLTVIRIDD